MSDEAGPASRARLAEEVKRWVRSVLGEGGTVLVTELQCAKRECPGVETVIALLARGTQRRWSLPRPMVELRRAEVEAALRGPAAGEPTAVTGLGPGRTP